MSEVRLIILTLLELSQKVFFTVFSKFSFVFHQKYLKFIILIIVSCGGVRNDGSINNIKSSQSFVEAFCQLWRSFVKFLLKHFGSSIKAFLSSTEAFKDRFNEKYLEPIKLSLIASESSLTFARAFKSSAQSSSATFWRSPSLLSWPRVYQNAFPFACFFFGRRFDAAAFPVKFYWWVASGSRGAVDSFGENNFRPWQRKGKKISKAALCCESLWYGFSFCAIMEHDDLICCENKGIRVGGAEGKAFHSQLRPAFQISSVVSAYLLFPS